jgi:hypothetical protein
MFVTYIVTEIDKNDSIQYHTVYDASVFFLKCISFPLLSADKLLWAVGDRPQEGEDVAKCALHAFSATNTALSRLPCDCRWVRVS